jgi:hypothetical protein
MRGSDVEHALEWVSIGLVVELRNMSVIKHEHYRRLLEHVASA